jgi:hypothetical protein
MQGSVLLAWQREAGSFTGQDPMSLLFAKQCNGMLFASVPVTQDRQVKHVQPLSLTPFPCGSWHESGRP